MLTPTLDLEAQLWAKGYQVVCGIDEVGRGCFAGPVVVGAVIFSPESQVPKGIADSKLLSKNQRDKLSLEIKNSCLDYAIAEISVSVINKVGIGEATQMAFRRVIKSLKKSPDFVLIDAFNIKGFSQEKQKAIPSGDTNCMSIAASSIIAKVYRDELMDNLDLEYPGYGFASHKGYGTKQHQEAIKKYGLCNLHRTSFNLEKYKG